MAYVLGDVILHDHYNTFATGSAAGTANHTVNNVNTIWGVGTGDKGYGQATTLAAVATGNTVTATQWSTLIARLNSILTHQTNTGTGITAPVATNTISAISTLQTKVDAAVTGRLTAASVGTDVSSSASGTATWVTSTTHTFTYAWTSADAARYFFNAGGTLRISGALSGGTVNSKYTDWVALIGAMGTITFGAHGTNKVGGSGTPTTLATTIGYYELTTVNQAIYKQFTGTTPYTTNYIQIDARYTGTLGANGDKSNTIVLTVGYYDAADDASIPASADQITGTLTTTSVVRPPEATNLTNTWGTVTVTPVNAQA